MRTLDGSSVYGGKVAMYMAGAREVMVSGLMVEDEELDVRLEDSEDRIAFSPTRLTLMEAFPRGPNDGLRRTDGTALSLRW